MRWSRYNFMFNSEKHGWLLYNSGSNTFCQLNNEAHREIEQIQASPAEYDFSNDPGLFFQLKSGGFLVEKGHDDDLYNIIKMRRTTQDFASTHLCLTIAPTRKCNFACPYCYEEDRDDIFMSDETEQQIIDFIARYKNCDHIALIWYGGEPLLAFDRILTLNSKIAELGKTFQSTIVTNGYLLSEDVIDKLDTLKTNLIQITLDGSEKTHDSRRFLIGGGNTFQTIVSKLDLLMKSSWEGRVNLRVNVDRTNEDEYKDVHYFIKDRYRELYGKRISVYPGYVHGEEGVHPDISCCFDKDRKAEFIIKQSNENGISDLNVFPGRTFSGCTALRRNSFVIGPEGELYKCWDDIGIEKMVVGHVGSNTNWNMGLIARYMVGSSFLNAQECKKCYFFPVCDGGCAHMREANLRDKKMDHCSYFKSHLKELLELHYSQKLDSENKGKV